MRGCRWKNGIYTPKEVILEACVSYLHTSITFLTAPAGTPELLNISEELLIIAIGTAGRIEVAFVIIV